MTTVGRDVVRTGPELNLSSTGKWLTPRDINAPVAILIHGFTSHGRYLQEMAEFLDGHDLCCATFNYDSYLGIDTAAKELVAALKYFEKSLLGHGYGLIGHSMGGLVARQFVHTVDSSLRKRLRGIVTLGTPHDGALTDQRWLGFMLDWADLLTDPSPFARSPLCRSAAQLTRQHSEPLIDRLNEDDRRKRLSHRMLSISGGQAYLELGKDSIIAVFKRHLGFDRNRLLQKIIGEHPNDGLVRESSADLTRVLGRQDGRIEHRNNYLSFSRTNHTNLARNQEVAGIVAQWLLAEFGENA